jgi:hypothetical protein
VHDLRATMRKLAFMVHPDRFSDAPAAARENAESLATLQVRRTLHVERATAHS